MDAGKAPPAVARPVRRPANFGSGSPPAAPLRPAKRGKCASRRRSPAPGPGRPPRCSRSAQSWSEPRDDPRPALGIRGSRDHPEIAVGACPAFMKTRDAGTTAATSDEPTSPRASLVATSRAPGRRPADTCSEFERATQGERRRGCRDRSNSIAPTAYGWMPLPWLLGPFFRRFWPARSWWRGGRVVRRPFLR